MLGLSLDHGGHLTHGSPVNASGLLYHFVSYGVGGEERIDMDVGPCARRIEHRPKLIVAGTTSYPRRLDPEPFKAIADEVGAMLMFDIAHLAGLVAGGAHPNPVPYSDVVTFTTHKTLRGPRGGCILSQGGSTPRRSTRRCSPAGRAVRSSTRSPARRSRSTRRRSRASASTRIRSSPNASALAAALAGEGFRLVSGGTDNHLMVVDLRPFDEELTGKVAQSTLDEAGITLNKNTVPDDPRSPFVTSGVRIGTPSVTTQGMTESEMPVIASLIARALRDRDDAGGARATSVPRSPISAPSSPPTRTASAVARVDAGANDRSLAARDARIR